MKKYLDENGVLKLLEGLKTQINNAKKKVFDTKGIANGIASLDENGNVPLSQLGNVDNILFEVVNVLPTELTEKQKNHIFIVPRGMETESDKNTYKEYIYTGEDLGHIDPSYWEELGEFTSEIDLNPYSKKDETASPSSFIFKKINESGELALVYTDAIGKEFQVKIPKVNSGNETDGLMSASDKNKLDKIDVNAFNKPDEEDITSKVVNNEHVLKFADKEYKPENFSGKGYKYLRKNIQKINLAVTKITVNSAPTKDGKISVTINNINTNISLIKNTHNTPALVAQAISDTLISAHTDYDIEVTDNIITLTRKYSGEVTSSTFNVSDTGVTINIEDSVKSVNRNVLTSDMIRNPNTIYEVRYDFDFENKTIVLPKDSILYFEGGSFSNVTLEGNNTIIQAQNYEIFKNVQLHGTWATFDFYVEWFGAKGDGTNDDTASIQKTLDVVLSVTLPFHIIVHLSKTYRITDTLNVHAETTLKGNFIGSYMNYAKTQYKCIVADFSDTKKWVIQSSNLKNTEYNKVIGKNPVDSGTIKYQEAIRIENIKIECYNSKSYYFGGIRIVASSNSSIRNCCIFDSCYGILRSATWYSSDRDNFIISVICALVFGHDMNAFSVYNGYYNASSSKNVEFTDDTMLDIDKSYKYKKNILAVYARGTIVNAITEHADCARLYVQSRIIDIGGWIEACSRCFEAFRGTTLTIIEPNVEANATTHFIKELDSCSVQYIGGDATTANVITKNDIWSGYTRTLNNYSRNISSVRNENVGLTLFSRIDKKVYWWNGEFWGDYTGYGVQTKNDGEFSDIPYEHKLKNGSIYMCANNGESIPIFQNKEGNFPYVKLTPTSLVMTNVITKNTPFKITLFDKISVTGTLYYKKEYDSYDYTYQILKRVAEFRKHTVGNLSIFNPYWKDGDECNADNLALIRTDTNESLIGKICRFQYIAPKKQSYVDALGFNANLAHRGTTEQRPTPTASDEGFEYYDSTLKKKILWNGTKWVNLDGTELS